MNRRRLLITAGLIAVGSTARGGTADSPFPSTISSTIDGKEIRFSLTGSALRRKYGFSVYTVASYVQEGAKVTDAEALAKADIPKILCLVFERDVEGQAIASSFRGSIGVNHPSPAFSKELDKLEKFFAGQNVVQGKRLWLTHLPGTGLICQFHGDSAMKIDSPAFSNAIWDTYLGPNGLGVAIKEGLTSKLR